MKQGRKAYESGFTKTMDEIRQVGGFGDPEQWRFDWERSYTRDQLLELLPTTGVLTRLPAEKVAEILAGIGDAIDATAGFTMPYTTVAVTATRTNRRLTGSDPAPAPPSPGHQV
ncbi:hypothetical protein [Amycolatopsis taiwanensis]|nr:hypothetical protein [Amycolatopsis taiwanensis]